MEETLENYSFRCVSCEENFIGSKDFSRHLKSAPHPRPIQCGDCVLSYEHLTSLIRHVKDVHIRPAQNAERREIDDGIGGAAAAAEQIPEGVVGDAGNEEEFMDHGQNIEQDRDSTDEDDPAIIDLVRSAGQMVLNVRERGSITGSAIERFKTECFKMMKDVSKSMKQKVRKFLADENIDTPQSRNLLKEPTVDDPFIHLRTMKQQLKYFAREMGMVLPETKFLDYRIDYRLNRNTLQYEPTRVPMSFEYVSIIKTLALLLKNEKIRNFVETESASQDGILRSYLDGRRAKTHVLVSRFPNILRIQLYWDDLDVVNPLGSKTSIHKIACFYFSIQNVPAVEGSQLSSIYLLALAYSEDLARADEFEKILSPFLAELRRLESETGVQVDIGIGRPYCLRATLVILCADTLAAHEILGLLSPAARHFCRLCMVSRPVFRLNMNAQGVRRTKAMLEEQVQLVIANHRSSTDFGVKSSCHLHLSRGFDGTQDATFDIFHDLLEGVCHWVISLTLRSFISVSKFFTLDQFNSRITAFNYGVTDIKNKPSANFTDASLKGSKLKQTGSQMWCLTRIFGFLVSDVPVDDENLKLVNLLQSILLIVFSDAILPEDIVRLEQLIEEHHNLFQRLHVTPDHDVFEELFDDVDDPGEPNENVGAAENAERRSLKKVTPGNKLHHMVHYPDLIRDYGSLIRYWCARYAGRHQIFCRYGAVCCNYVNIVKSMAQMYQLSTFGGLLKTTCRAEEMDVQSAKATSVDRSQHGELLVGCGFRLQDVVLDVESVSITGETYRPGLFVLVETSTPTITLIQHIYMKDNQVYLILNPWKTEPLERRFCAYQVCADGNGLIIRRHNELGRHGAFTPWNPWNQRTIFIAPRTIVF